MPVEIHTQPSLLLRIRRPADAEAWRQFVDLYAPLVYGFLRKQGLQDADAADVAQDVLRTVSQQIGQLEYDRSRGSFRGWLFTIVNSRLMDFRRRGQRERALVAHAVADVAQHEHEETASSAEWDLDYQRQLFHAAAERVRGDFGPSAWRAFWQAAVEGRPAKEIAADLGMSPAAVYLAKARVMNRIREELETLTGESA
ncbi:MAG: sigma-70 family RNA polymerase sigma factor [Planctomycetaceae bacterium]|nr:sigma-70 family RNA polymerase sigma factor [Planctomycetaceae bacterium]